MTIEFDYKAVYEAIEKAEKEGIGSVFNVSLRDANIPSKSRNDVEDAIKYFLVENSDIILPLFRKYIKERIIDNINTLEELKR